MKSFPFSVEEAHEIDNSKREKRCKSETIKSKL